MTNLIDNTPTSAIAAAPIGTGKLNIQEIGLDCHLMQLAIFPESHAQTDEKIQSASKNAGYQLSLPKFGHKSTCEAVKVLATQPNKWLFIADKQPDWLLEIVDNELVFANEQSSSYSIIEITGDNASQFVQQLCFIDLETANPVLLTQFANDYNGILEKVEKEGQQAYHLYVTRTMAKSFWEMLAPIAVEQS